MQDEEAGKAAFIHLLKQHDIPIRHTNNKVKRFSLPNKTKHAKVKIRTSEYVLLVDTSHFLKKKRFFYICRISKERYEGGLFALPNIPLLQ